jgi:radical SAM superfamily enzyme YgiQ (UPF0313 family)
MKVLLINPPLPWKSSTMHPLGLGYIAAVLEKNGYKARVVDMFDYGWDEVEACIRQESADIVGVSCLTNARSNSLRVAKIAKEISPLTKVILGGPHASFMHKQILEHYPVDAIVIGEGEVTALELIRAFEDGRSLSGVLGIAFKQNGKIIKTEDRPFIEDLDSLPFPSHQQFDFNRYKKEGVDVNKYMVDIITSRGCPFECLFCSSCKFWGKSWRFRSSKNIADELQLLKDNFGIEAFNFSDDIFTIRKDNVIALCKEIIERNLGVTWFAQSRVNCVSKEMLEWMKRAGCKTIAYGIESGSPRILKVINKDITVEQAIEAFRITKEAGLNADAFFMVGNPGETEETVRQTCALIDRIQPHHIVVSVTVVYPESKLCELAKQNHLLNDDYWLGDKPAPAYTAQWSESKLNFWRMKVLFHFLKKKGIGYTLKKVFSTPRKNVISTLSGLFRAKNKYN